MELQNVLHINICIRIHINICIYMYICIFWEIHTQAHARTYVVTSILALRASGVDAVAERVAYRYMYMFTYTQI